MVPPGENDWICASFGPLESITQMANLRHCGVTVAWRCKTWKKCLIFAFFWKNGPLPEHFWNSVLKVFIASLTDSCVQILWNLADRKWVKCVLFTWQKFFKNFALLSHCRYSADRAQNLPGIKLVIYNYLQYLSSSINYITQSTPDTYDQEIIIVCTLHTL